MLPVWKDSTPLFSQPVGPDQVAHEGMNLANGLTQATRPHGTLSRVWLSLAPFQGALTAFITGAIFQEMGVTRFARPSCPCPPLPVHEQGQDWRPPIPAAYLSTSGRPPSPGLPLPGLCGEARRSPATPCKLTPAPGPSGAFSCAKGNFRENERPAPHPALPVPWRHRCYRRRS